MKIGDTVILKAGGPAMSIVSAEGRDLDAKADCAWFHEGRLQTQTFPMACLRRNSNRRKTIYLGLPHVIAGPRPIKKAAS